MKYTVEIVSLPAKEYFVIKGYGKLYDSDVQSASQSDEDTWKMIQKHFRNGSVERLKNSACSNEVFMLFCNTCIRNEDEKCYVCGYDIACENHSGKNISGDFETVTLNPCEYAMFSCEFDNEITLSNAHEKSDAVFWNEWLKDSPYICPIDDLANCLGNGFAAIEQYFPFDHNVNKFNANMWYPIQLKE